MTINVKIPVHKQAPAIKVKLSNTGQIVTEYPVTIKTTTPPVANRLDRLVDVDPSGEVEGAVAVYDESTDTYVVKKLNIDQIEGEIDNIDGGTF